MKNRSKMYLKKRNQIVLKYLGLGFALFSFGNANSQKIVTISPSISYQTVDGFGASDCWGMQFVGKYWSENAKEEVARLLFDQRIEKDRKPQGIGLSNWRFNLGGGTMELGADTANINQPDRRVECFLDKNGNYNWSKQSGEQWFLQKAKEYGCETFTLFSNTPPVFFTRNGQGYAPADGKANLQADRYDDFADFMATVLQHFDSEKGIHFDFVSPVNEPQWDWKGKNQEGSPWQNGEIKKLVVALDSCISSQKLTTKIVVGEAGKWESLYQTKGERADNQIYEFFDSASPNYIGNLRNLEPALSAHSYWTVRTNQMLKETRQKAFEKARQYNLKLHHTEWCMMTHPHELIDGMPKTMEETSHMDIALLLAKVIHSDLAFANASSWAYWNVVDKERWKTKNRYFLIQLMPEGGDNQSIITSPGAVKASKNLWALGNYSLFIRPGYRRIQMDGVGADSLGSIMATSYISPQKNRIVSVYINMEEQDVSVIARFSGLGDGGVRRNQLYCTNKSYDLQPLPVRNNYSDSNVITIPARSVCTVVYELETKM